MAKRVERNVAQSARRLLFLGYHDPTLIPQALSIATQDVGARRSQINPLDAIVQLTSVGQPAFWTAARSMERGCV